MERKLDFKALVKKTQWTIVKQFCLNVIVAYIFPISTVSIDIHSENQSIASGLLGLLFNVFSWVYICISLIIIVSINIKALLTRVKQEMEIVYHGSMWLTSVNNSSNLTILEFIETNKHIELMQQRIKNNQLDSYFNQLINYSKTFYSYQISFHQYRINNLSKILEQECEYLIGDNIDYKYNSKIDRDCSIELDLDLIIRSVANIVNNAMAYADDSKKRIRVIFELEDGSIALSIWNNGSKFSDDVLKNFGKLFYREDTSRNSQFEHFGIGLAFVKQVMSIHSGDIQLQNKEKGAMVKLIIPIKNSDNT